MDKAARKSAIADYRQKKGDAGIYAVRCAASGEVWVGSTSDLAAIRNRIFFSLRQGSSPHLTLQAAWHAHGADNLAFEVLERLDAEELGIALTREMKNHHADWMQKLGATRI